MKPIIWWSVAIALGVLLVGGGLVSALTGHAGPVEVTCGSQHMLPGETCEQTSGGHITVYSYEDMQRSAVAGAETGPWVAVVAGGLLGLLGGFKLWRALRRRRVTAAQFQPVPAQPWTVQPQYAQPQYQQPPQYAQQQYPQPPQHFGPHGS